MHGGPGRRRGHERRPPPPVARARPDPGVRFQRHHQLQQVPVESPVQGALIFSQRACQEPEQEVSVDQGHDKSSEERAALVDGLRLLRIVVSRDEEDAEVLRGVSVHDNELF